jgi:hypothetical protein
MNVGRYLRGEDLHVGTSRITKPKELKMNQPLVKRSLAELDTVVDEIVQRNPAWYKEIQQLVAELKSRNQDDVKR